MPGIQEWLVIAVIGLLVVGPDRLPQMARTVGQVIARLRAETQKSVQEIQRVAEIQELQQELDGIRRELRGAGADVKRRIEGEGVGAPRGGSSGAGSSRDDAVTVPFDPEAT